MSHLFAAAYISTPSVPFDDHVLSGLLLAARRWNAQHGITGKLVVAEAEEADGSTSVRRFVQWIEGEPDDVRVCLQRIYDDARHTEFEIQYFGPVGARRYPTWDMAIEVVPAHQWPQAAETVIPERQPVTVEEVLGGA